MPFDLENTQFPSPLRSIQSIEKSSRGKERHRRKKGKGGNEKEKEKNLNQKMTPNSGRDADSSPEGVLREDTFETSVGKKITAPGEEADDNALENNRGRHIDVTA